MSTYTSPRATLTSLAIASAIASLFAADAENASTSGTQPRRRVAWMWIGSFLRRLGSASCLMVMFCGRFTSSLGLGPGT